MDFLPDIVTALVPLLGAVCGYLAGKLRALWGLAHTKDPARAKPWVDPYGTSGMYMSGECYRAEDGTVYRCKQDNCVYDAQALPSAWEEV